MNLSWLHALGLLCVKEVSMINSSSVYALVRTEYSVNYSDMRGNTHLSHNGENKGLPISVKKLFRSKIHFLFIWIGIVCLS